MSVFERLRKVHEEKTDSRKLRLESFFLGCGTVAVDCRGDCGDWIPGPGLDQNSMKARQPELRGIPQFDSGRWKLRLELVPLSTDKQPYNQHNSCEIETAGLLSASQRFRSDAELQ
jgi:hypothetical protein